VTLPVSKRCRLFSTRLTSSTDGILMTRTYRFSLLAAIVVASIVTGGVARAQDKVAPKAAPARAADSVSVEDVHRAAEQLAEAVHAAVRKATEDPAVKVAALKVAKNAVVAAQAAITLHAETLQAVLDSLAREIAAAAEKQQAKVRSH
jgi:hypothetical protein